MNRDNYEMFFLLYTDNELDAAEQKVVEAFVALHADLKEELNAMLQTRLSANETVPFVHKESLYKTSGATFFIDADNYEEYFVLYADGELNAEEQKAVESFIENHPQQQAELLHLQRAKIQPDHSIVFSGKASLYRKEKTAARVIAFQWRRMVAAASIIAIGSWLWMNAGNIIPQQVAEQPLTSKASQKAQPQVLQDKAITTAPVTIKEEAELLAKANKAEATGETKQTLVKTPKVSTPGLSAEHSIPANSIANNEGIKSTGTVNQAPALNDEAPKLIAHLPPVIVTKNIADKNALVGEEVQPLISDQAAFRQKDNEMIYEAATKTDEGIAYLDTDNTEKKSKGKFRGLLRRVSRLVDHVTNPDIDDKQAIVRVASFEITRKQ